MPSKLEVIYCGRIENAGRIVKEVLDYFFRAGNLLHVEFSKNCERKSCSDFTDDRIFFLQL